MATRMCTFILRFNKLIVLIRMVLGFSLSLTLSLLSHTLPSLTLSPLSLSPLSHTLPSLTLPSLSLLSLSISPLSSLLFFPLLL